MRLVRYDRFSGIDGLYVDEAPMPEPAPGEVLLRVMASCINPGSLSALHGAPYVPKRDLAGIVTAVGDGVEAVAVDDTVLGWAQGWEAHAQYVSVPAGQLTGKPPGLSWDVAGSLYVTPMAGMGAVRTIRPQAGELIVIVGASGGVGLAAAQLAMRAGADVIGVASAANMELLRTHGIVPVDYAEDPGQGIRAAAKGRRVDGFIDAVGKGYLELGLELGVEAGRIATVVDHQLAGERGVRFASTLDGGGIDELHDLALMAAANTLHIPIGRAFPLEEVQAAYRALSDRTESGRIVLHPQD